MIETLFNICEYGGRLVAVAAIGAFLALAFLVFFETMIELWKALVERYF